MNLPQVVSTAEWEAARVGLLVKEKEATQTPRYEWWRRHDEYEEER